MNSIYLIFVSSSIILLLVSCANKDALRSGTEPFQFIHPKVGSEYTVVRVTKGAGRAEVEAGLIQDQVGSDTLAEVYEKNFSFVRINSKEDLEEILVKYFGGGNAYVRKLWSQYPNATYSGLEADNYVIVFFDTKDKAIIAWPQ